MRLSGWMRDALILLACSCTAFSARAECPDYSGAQPATLISNEKQGKNLGKLVKAWKTEEPARVIKFGAYINARGTLDGICCTSSSYTLTRGAYRMLRNRLRALRFEPATHNGQPLEVFVGFTLVAQKAEDGVNVRLLMNQQHSMSQLGIDYTAPQRVRAGSMWARSRASTGDVRVNVVVDVDATGRASNARVLETTLSSASLDNTLASRVQSACYVPGRSDGKPAAMVYAELFGQG